MHRQRDLELLNLHESSVIFCKKSDGAKEKVATCLPFCYASDRPDGPNLRHSQKPRRRRADGTRHAAGTGTGTGKGRSELARDPSCALRLLSWGVSLAHF